jgi:hypothetical protein
VAWGKYFAIFLNPRRINLLRRTSMKRMKTFYKFFTVMLLIFSFFLSPLWAGSEIKNPDRPLKGEWDFKPEHVWTIGKAGEEPLARPGALLVSDDGTVYVYDPKNRKNYMFNKDGQFIKSFAGRGEGPGEVRGQGPFFLVNDKIIIPEWGRVHYFTKNGDYIESKAFTGVQRMPVFSLDENELVLVSVVPQDEPDGIGEITAQNLQSGKMSVIKKFPMFMGGTAGSGENELYVIFNALSPIMVVGYDPVQKKIYYGNSDSYLIDVTDLKGNQLHSFSVQRKKRKVPAAVKKERFKGLYQDFPKDVIDQLYKSVPDEATLFNRNDIVNGLVYVFVPYVVPTTPQQEVDIFSLDGKYLYRGVIRVGSDLTIVFSEFKNLIIKNNHLYVVVEDKDGVRKLAKYKVVLPGH